MDQHCHRRNRWNRLRSSCRSSSAHRGPGVGRYALCSSPCTGGPMPTTRQDPPCTEASLFPAQRGRVGSFGLAGCAKRAPGEQGAPGGGSASRHDQRGLAQGARGGSPSLHDQRGLAQGSPGGRGLSRHDQPGLAQGGMVCPQPARHATLPRSSPLLRHPQAAPVGFGHDAVFQVPKQADHHDVCLRSLSDPQGREMLEAHCFPAPQRHGGDGTGDAHCARMLQRQDTSRNPQKACDGRAAVAMDLETSPACRAVAAASTSGCPEEIKQFEVQILLAAQNVLLATRAAAQRLERQCARFDEACPPPDVCY